MKSATGRNKSSSVSAAGRKRRGAAVCGSSGPKRLDELLDRVLEKYALRQRPLFDKHPADWKLDDEAQQIDAEQVEAARRRRVRIVGLDRLNAELAAIANEVQAAAG